MKLGVYKNMKLRIGSLALVLVVLGFLVWQDTVFADNVWGDYHWSRQEAKFTLQLGDNVDSNWDTYLLNSINGWNTSTVITLEQTAGGTRPRRCKITKGRVEVCNAKYGFNGWLGIAGISVSGSHITGGYVKMNDSYYNTSTYNTPAWRNLVMCQELGHTFGLDHQDADFNNSNLSTCMDYTNNPDTNQYPNAHDFDMIETMYAHLDDTSTIGSGSGDKKPCRGRKCKGQDVDFSDPQEWGRIVKFDAKGRAIRYMRDLGDGRKHFTHIYPVPDARRTERRPN